MGLNVGQFFFCAEFLLIEFYRTVHGASGYLITQFLDSTSNLRTDQWGGSVENRSRFGLEVLKVLIEVFGPDVGLKLSPAGGYNDVGYVSFVRPLPTISSHILQDALAGNPRYLQLFHQ